MVAAVEETVRVGRATGAAPIPNVETQISLGATSATVATKTNQMVAVIAMVEIDVAVVTGASAVAAPQVVGSGVVIDREVAVDSIEGTEGLEDRQEVVVLEEEAVVVVEEEIVEMGAIALGPIRCTNYFEDLRSIAYLRFRYISLYLYNVRFALCV